MEAPKPLCCQHAEIEAQPNSKISFGYGCIVHPKAKIIIESDCSLTFGEYNIIEENVTIKVARVDNQPKQIYIGNYNYFKIGTYLENTTVENYNILDINCSAINSYIESGVVLTPLVKVKDTLLKGKNIYLSDGNVDNHNFNEEAFKGRINDMQKILFTKLPKQNKIRDI